MPAGCRRLDAGRFPFLTGTDSGLFLDAVTSKEVSALRYPLAVAVLVVIVTAGVVTAGVVSRGVAPAAGTPAGVPQTSAPQTDATTGTGNDTATLAPGLTADGATLDRRHYGTFRDGPGLLDLSQYERGVVHSLSLSQPETYRGQPSFVTHAICVTNVGNTTVERRLWHDDALRNATVDES
jgi:hypothetical protein